MPPSIICNEVDFSVCILTDELLEEREIRLAIEDFDKSEMKFRLFLNRNGADDFDAFPSGIAFNARSDSFTSPVTIDGAGLLE
jgi:hypothetical protein